MPQSTPQAPARPILRGYAEAWAEESARAAGKATAPDAAVRPSTMLVDAFAGADYPAPEPGLSGAMGAAARLLREGSAAGGVVLMLEEDPAKLEWLASRLSLVLPEGGAIETEPVRGAATLWEGDASRLGSLAELRGAAAATLLLADPPSAGALPLEVARPWLAEPGSDVLIRLPLAELRRLAVHRGSPIADLPPRLRRSVEGVSAFLGDPRCSWMHAWARSLAGGVEGALEGVAAAYRERALERGAPIARRVRVPAPEGHDELLLCTHRPTSALLLNRVLLELRVEGVLPWPEDDASSAVRYLPRAELALFAGEAGCPDGTDRVRVVDRCGLASSLGACFRGRTVKYEDVLRSHADGDLLAEEVRGALLTLRRQGRAEFGTLTLDAPIAFPGSGAPRPRSRRRRTDRATELELGL